MLSTTSQHENLEQDSTFGAESAALYDIKCFRKIALFINIENLVGFSDNIGTYDSKILPIFVQTDNIYNQQKY